MMKFTKLAGAMAAVGLLGAVSGNVGAAGALGTLHIDGESVDLDSITIETNEEGGIQVMAVTSSGSGDDGSTDDGSTDDGSTDDGSTDDGSTDDGTVDDSCDVASNVRLMGEFPPSRETFELSGNDVLAFDMKYASGTEGRHETYSTSSNNATRGTWISTCPGGDPLPEPTETDSTVAWLQERYCSSRGTEATSVQWKTWFEKAAMCPLEPGKQYYFNVTGNKSTFYGRTYID